jgi:hypothetical protein
MRNGLRGAAEHRREDAAELSFGIVAEPARAPGHMRVGADQDAAVLAYLSCSRPVLVDIDVLAAGPDDMGRHLDAQLAAGQVVGW